MNNIKVLLFFVDVSLVYFGFAVSFWLRFHPRSAAREFFLENFTVIPILILIYVFVLIVSGVYQNKFPPKYKLITKVFRALSLALLVGMSFLYVFREKWGTFPSSIFLISFPIIFLLLVIAKLIIYKLYSNT